MQWAGIECPSDFAGAALSVIGFRSLIVGRITNQSLHRMVEYPEIEILIEASNCVRQVCFKMQELVENLEDHKGGLSSSPFRSPYLFPSISALPIFELERRQGFHEIPIRFCRGGSAM